MEFLKLSSIKMATVAFIFLFSAGCSLLDPFVDRRRNAGAEDIRHLYVGRSRPEAPAVCYNGLWTDEKTIQEIADAECLKQKTGSHAQKTNQTSFTCKMFLPTHAYFKCVP